MSKSLVVQYRGRSLSLTLEKVDRSQLYGYVDTEVLDDQGRHCELATLTGDGHTLFGRGSAAIGQLSPSGLWREKSKLKPVDSNGKVITPVASTFAAPVTLEKKTDIDDYLAHNVHLVYRLVSEGDATDLLKELREGTIYTFPFSYRGGLEAYDGFLLASSDGNLFLAVGTAPRFEFVGLRQPAGMTEEETEEAEEETMDFGMI
jgi:hypothetical protein